MQINSPVAKTKKTIVSLIFLYLAAASNLAMAQEPIPNLIGTWSGPNNTISETKGYKTHKKTIEITEQKGRRFRGQFNYAGDIKNFFGVIYPDNISFTWVSTNSNGYNFGRILGKDHISACFIEAGAKATAGCAELKRQP